MRTEVWLHVPSMITAAVTGDQGEFYFNSRKEFSYWGLIRQDPERGWVFICEL